MDRLLKLSLWLAAKVNQAWAVRFSTWIGRLSLLFNSEASQVTRINLQTCFPHLSDVELDQLVRARLAQVPLLFFEFAQLAHWPLKDLLSQIHRVDNEAILKEAFESEQGVLLLVPHYGNWEILCAFLGAHYSVAALYDPPKVASLESVIVSARQRYDGQMYPIDTGGMRSIFKTLRAGKLVAVLPDQVPDRESGVYVDFFGQPALTMTLTHKLVQRSRPRVIMGSVRREYSKTESAGQVFSYELSFRELGADVYSEDSQVSARCVNAAIEDVIEQDIAQYQWEYKRFKRPPKRGKMNIYRRQ